jgi:tetratricopeptide (TPR) repeat protein
MDEALAFLTSLRILRENGYGDVAQKYYQYYNQDITPIDIPALRCAQKKRHWSPPKRYPENFHRMAYRLGLALNCLFTWDELCALVHVRNLEEWLEKLPSESRFYASHFLLQPEKDVLLALTESKNFDAEQFVDALLDFGLAYEKIGHLQQSERLYWESLRLRPENPEAYRNLSYTLLKLGKHEDAVNACNKLIDLSDDLPKDYYNLGIMLSQVGRIAEARQVWEKALQQGEARIARIAKEALEENPL